MTSYDQGVYDQQPGAGDGGTLVDKDYVRSLKGILKAAEIVLSTTIIITSSVWEQKTIATGGGWAQFVSTTALVLTCLLYALYVFRVADRLRAALGVYSLLEFGFHAGVTLCYFITAIIAAVFGARHPAIGASAEVLFHALVAVCYVIAGIVAAYFCAPFNHRDWGYVLDAAAATAFFCFAILVPYGIDTFFAFSTYRSQPAGGPAAAGGGGMPPQQPPAATMDPISSVERGPQY